MDYIFQRWMLKVGLRLEGYTLVECDDMMVQFFFDVDYKLVKQMVETLFMLEQ